jgi:hypothetical protein
MYFALVFIYKMFFSILCFLLYNEWLFIMYTLHNALCWKRVCLNDCKEEFRAQLKYYGNLLDRLEEMYHLLNKKFYNYEILLLSISGNN